MPEPQLSAWALAQGGAWGALVCLSVYMAKVLWTDLRATLAKREDDVKSLTTALNEATSAQREHAAAMRQLAEASRAQTDAIESVAARLDDLRGRGESRGGRS